MAASSVCDICGNEPGRWLMHDQDTGEVRGLGADCLPMVGIGLLMQLEPALIDGTLKEFGYAPTKALRDQRKAEAAPEYDPNRVIGEVVESAPTPPEVESTSDQADESTDTQADLSTNEPVDLTPDDFVLHGAEDPPGSITEAESDPGPPPPY